MSCFYVLIASVLLIFSAGCSRQPGQKQTPPDVVVCIVIEKEVKPSHTVVGDVLAFQKVELVPRVTGFIDKQNVQDGAFAKKGELIFLIQQEQYKAEVLSAEGDVEKAKAALKHAQIEYNRQDTLLKKNAVSQRDFDTAAATLGGAEGDLKLAEASLINAKLNLSYTSINAPFDGKVGIAAYDPDNLVTPESKALITIVSIDPILVQFSITEVVLMQYLKENAKQIDKDHSPQSVLQDNVIVKLLLSNGSQYPISGKIAYIDNMVDPTTGSIIIRAQFDNPNHILIPGSYVKVILERKTPINVIYIPQDCIQEDQLGDYVYVLEKDDKVKYQHVEIGSVYGMGISITKGLAVGDKVVYQGLDKIKDGTIVNPTEINIETIISDKEAGKELTSEKTDSGTVSNAPEKKDSSDTQINNPEKK